MSLSFLDRGRGGTTVQMQAPPGASMGNSSALSTIRGATTDPMGDAYISLQGRASLTLLAGLIVLSVVFYMWTRDAQGS